MSQLNTDLPYFEPLVLFLKRSEKLKGLFGQKDFFAEPNIDVNDKNNQVDGEGRNRKYFWVYPGSSRSKSSRPQGCIPIAEHEFYIVVMSSCPRNKFAWVADNDEVHLQGVVMEVLAIRKAIKEEVNRFWSESKRKYSTSGGFRELRWDSDATIDYNKSENDCGFITAMTKYKLDLIN